MSKRFAPHPLLVLLIPIAAVLAACGGAASEPTPVPPTPTSTPAPTPTPAIALITTSPDADFEGFIEQMPKADVECLTVAFGMDRLAELASGSDADESERDVLSSCFSNELVVGFIAGQIHSELGGFSGSSMACLDALLGDIPTGALSPLMFGDGQPEGEAVEYATQGFVECLTGEELAALASVGDDDSATVSADGQRVGYASREEECMVGVLGEQFADGYGGVLAGDVVSEFEAALGICGVGTDFSSMVTKLEDSEARYKITSLTDAGFKNSKSYDVRELDSASTAHYGFYGVDPYNRLEYEVRFYLSHEAARTTGVEWAGEATGAGVSLYADDQRWQEGLSERRRCDASGGHHVGQCGFPKYFDYVVVGNMILMCQGKDTLESLAACADLLNVLN